jgi:hypothetical protein
MGCVCEGVACAKGGPDGVESIFCRKANPWCYEAAANGMEYVSAMRISAISALRPSDRLRPLS